MEVDIALSSQGSHSAYVETLFLLHVVIFVTVQCQMTLKRPAIFFNVDVYRPPAKSLKRELSCDDLVSHNPTLGRLRVPL